MMLRTFAALSLGTLAATTAVASIASITTQDRDETEAPAVAPRSTTSVAAKGRPAWTGIARELVAEGILDDLQAKADQLATRRRAAGDEGVIREIRPAIEIAKKPNDEIRLTYDLDGELAVSGRIQIKFRDGLGARASLAGTTPALSMTGHDMQGFNALLAAGNATVEQMIQMPEAAIEDIRRKAFERSGRIQPDLAAMMYVELPEGTDWERILELAHDLNDLDDLEWVSLEPVFDTYQQADCDPANPVICNRPNPNPGMGCWDGDINAPAPWPGACNPDPGDLMMAAEAACADVGCCNQVSAFVPYCDDADQAGGWDVYCAAAANVICTGTVYDLENPGLGDPDRYDPCLSNYNPGLFDGGDLNYTGDPETAVRLGVFGNVAGFLLDTCFDPHVTPGCSIPACCASICVVDPTCCTEEWDQDCVDFATSGDFPGCENPQNPDATTPNFSELTVDADGLSLGLQAFLTSRPFNNPFDPQTGDPMETARGTWPRFSNFTGGGLNIEGGHATVGVIWRLYGSGAIGGNALLPNPEMVWMDGAEFEVVPAADCTTGDCIEIQPALPRTQDNPFPSFAVDANFDYSTIRLRPTGQVEHVAVCEFSAFVNHEEWCKATPDGEYGPTSTIVEEGQTLTYLDSGNANHGLACLGTTVAPDNGFGVIGIAPRAQGYFYPIESVEEGSRIPTALAAMIRDLPVGAIINHSWGPTAPGLCLTGVEPAYTLIRASSDSGLVTCIAAGNEGAPLEPEAGETPSGAIIVGAREPGLLLEGLCAAPRRIYFSNFTSEELSITVNAWGIMGTTTGYGAVWSGEDPRNGTDINFVEAQFTRAYTGPTPGNGTGGFNGTSFASPQIAGACALIQGGFRMFWDTTVNSDTMGGIFGPPDPSNCQTLGYPPDCPLNGPGLCGDILPPPPADPGGVVTNIGPVCNLPGAIAGTLTAVNDATGGDLVIHTGTRLSGGGISLSAVDANYLVIRSEFAGQGPAPDDFAYYGTGPTIDFTMSTFGGTGEGANNLNVVTAGRVDNTLIVEVVFARNFVSERWVPLGVEVLGTANGQRSFPIGTDTNGTEPYLNDLGQVDVRVYALGLGFVNGGDYRGYWDQVAVEANANEPL